MSKFSWIGISFVTVGIIVVAVALVLIPEEKSHDPWAYLPEHEPHVDHSALIEGPLETGQDVTRVCLTCHEDAAQEVMQTVHWTWQAPPVEVSWRDEPVSIGKANLVNNFCLGIQSNWTGCTRCHAGYGWTDDTFFETASEEDVDCLVCHDQSGQYAKAASGKPADTVDLMLAAQSVGLPTRENCGSCHFNGGGGNGVKHGDLDESLYFPTEDLDVHMGKYDFQCTDCHRTSHHQISGRGLSVSVDNKNQIACTDCHQSTPHEDERLNSHTDAVACQTCHIPAFAREDPTKLVWRWSDAGQEGREEDPHEYLKIKGSFVYANDVVPTYMWFNGERQRYLLGDPIDEDGLTSINLPLGSIDDPNALIFPFKIHYADQPYDVNYNYLLVPNTVGPEGYWTTFDWNSALQRGSAATGLPYSGEYGFTQTEMYWPITHMVTPADQALQCTQCHGENGRMDWEALGYPGDPMIWGGRDQ